MTNINTSGNTYPTNDYMGNFGWFPWIDGFHDCDNGKDVGDGMEIFHGAGSPSDEIVIVTVDGMFCSKSCAEMARRNAIYEEALEDRDSWYWDGIEYGEER